MTEDSKLGTIASQRVLLNQNFLKLVLVFRKILEYLLSACVTADTSVRRSVASTTVEGQVGITKNNLSS